ncbi:MAG: type II 3-dehydroquinate dehydratase [Candidatus Fimivivens sp.]
MKLLVINGPNINLLGIREKHIYGSADYARLLEMIQNTCVENDIEAECFQSNHEGDIIDKIQAAYGTKDAIVINPAAYTHTSIAILDALKAVGLPAVEVHISNVYEREEFRHHSYIKMACIKSFVGLGLDGYRQAILYLKQYVA